MNQVSNKSMGLDQVMPLLAGAGMALIAVAGLVHIVDAPENLVEAPYKGWLFLLNGLGAIISAVGIYRGERNWGWLLGLAVSVSAIVGYIVSRTVGLPGLEVDSNWLEGMGVISVLAEAAFVVIAVYALRLLPKARS